jgi:hypothetical protein
LALLAKSFSLAVSSSRWLTFNSLKTSFHSNKDKLLS